MKKNGIEFNLQDQKFHQGAYCFICGKKIEKGEKERISVVTPYMHLCLDCSVSKKNIPAKKGATIKWKDRIFMWVGKGIRGNHICDLTKQEIKNGTPCWWSSKKDDPEGKTESYVLSFDLEEPNEYDVGETTPVLSFKNDLKKIDNQIYTEEVKNKAEEKKIDPWWDDNYKSIRLVHSEEDIKTFFQQVFGKEYKEDEVFLKVSDKQYLTMYEYVKYIMIENRKYFVFWQDRSIDSGAMIYFITKPRILEAIKCVGEDNTYKEIKNIRLNVSSDLCEKYEKVEGFWKRKD